MRHAAFFGSVQDLLPSGFEPFFEPNWDIIMANAAQLTLKATLRGLVAGWLALALLQLADPAKATAPANSPAGAITLHIPAAR